jgi:hypothetical protein
VKRPPACMTGVEFVEWTTANEWLRNTNGFASSPCADCTKDWHAQMQDADKCDGYPGRQYQRRDTPEEVRERRRVLAKAWRDANPEKSRAISRRYRMKQAAA